jgi:hypothetical protein
MKKLIIAIALMVSSSAIAQTNYNTCMNPCKQRRDSLTREINLHMTKANRLEKVGSVLAIAAIASAVTNYYLFDGKQSIFIPLVIGSGALFTYHLSARQEMKADKLRKSIY